MHVQFSLVGKTPIAYPYPERG